MKTHLLIASHGYGPFTQKTFSTLKNINIKPCKVNSEHSLVFKASSNLPFPQVFRTTLISFSGQSCVTDHKGQRAETDEVLACTQVIQSNENPSRVGADWEAGIHNYTPPEHDSLLDQMSAEGDILASQIQSHPPHRRHQISTVIIKQ